MLWQRIFPVLVSVAVIILVAVMQERSKLVAAITATMPLTVTLSLWIVYTAEDGDKTGVTRYAESLLVGGIPLLFFLAAVLFGARRGWSIVPLIVGGYAAWAAGLALLLALRQLVGR